MPPASNDKKRVIGLTGGFGSGKSTVAGMFKSFGARIVDADRIAHSLLSPRGGMYRDIIGIFGEKILKADRTIDRRALAREVFSCPRLLKRLNAIIHPQVKKIIGEKIRGYGAGVIIVDAPLLFETGLDKAMDAVIAVIIERSEQLRRLKEKGLSEKESMLRIRRQMPLREKARRADFRIDNSGTRKETRAQARALWQRIRAS